jgi:hypothetical protein
MAVRRQPEGDFLTVKRAAGHQSQVAGEYSDARH